MKNAVEKLSLDRVWWTRAKVSSALLLVLVAACGDDGEEGGTPQDEGDAAISSLSGERIRALCEKAVSKQNVCRTLLYLDDCVYEEGLHATDSAACEDAVAACVMGEAPAVVPKPTCDDEQDFAQQITCLDLAQCEDALGAPGCDATVAELEACSDAFDLQCSALSLPSTGWDCSVAAGEDTDEEFARDAWDEGPRPDYFSVPAPCQRFAEACGALPGWDPSALVSHD